MSYGEDILKLRKKMVDAVKEGVVDNDNKDFLEATLLQIMNDAEKSRQNCVAQAENLRRQASMMDGQASAFASVSSIVYNVLNGYVSAAERSRKEQEEIAERESAATEEPSAEDEENKKKKKK